MISKCNHCYHFAQTHIRLHFSARHIPPVAQGVPHGSMVLCRVSTCQLGLTVIGLTIWRPSPPRVWFVAVWNTSPTLRD
jgi:hypothetical protein